jgi:hypothetical protein
LINLNSVIQNPPILIKNIRKKLEIYLDLPDRQVYDSSLIKTQIAESVHPYIIQEFFPKISNLYNQLNAMADLTDADLVNLNPHLISNQFLRDWVDLRHLQRNYTTITTKTVENAKEQN